MLLTSLILDGALKIVQIVRVERQRQSARIFDPRGTVPEKVLDEIQNNVFIDRETNKQYQYTATGLIAI